MDPIEIFPIEIMELILQHLTVNNLLAVTELSPLWNKTICGYSNFIEKATIKILDHNISPHKHTRDWNNLKYLSVPSLRKYQNIHFSAKPEIIDDIKNILAVPGSEWKKVYIKVKQLDGNLYPFRGKWSADFYEVFRMIEKDVEDLHLDILDSTLLSAFSGSWFFANLKVLRMRFYGMPMAAFENCRQLKELSIMHIRSDSVGSLKKIIEHNSLSNLEISSTVIKFLFDHKYDINFNRLKLKTFCVHSGDSMTGLRPKFQEFLTSQKQSLEHLSVGTLISQLFFYLMLCLPNLKTLSVTNFNSTRPMHLSLNSLIRINLSIESICFIDKNVNFDVMKAFVLATPNLTHLEMYSMHQSMMKYLSAKAKHLKSLKLQRLDATDFSDRKLFSQLEKLSISFITSAKKDEMLKIPFYERNRFVKLLLESNYTIFH